MKKLFLFACLLAGLTVFAQNRTIPYDFPVKSGSPAWQQFRSVNDMYKACQIPDDTLQSLSTAALLQTCLNYPAKSILFIHSSPQAGFDAWKTNFNGVAELLQRKDAPAILQAVYQAFKVSGHTNMKSEVDKGLYTFSLQTLEAIIVQDEILKQLAPTLLQQFASLALQKYKALEADKLYGFSNLASTGRIILKTTRFLTASKSDTATPFPELSLFLQTGQLADQASFVKSIAEAGKILAGF